MKFLFIGDIVAKPGRRTVVRELPQIIEKYNPDIVLANGENLAHGRGATKETMEEMQNAGVGFFTGGDHLFWHRGFKDIVDELPIVRPANYPPAMPGKTYEIVDTGKAGKLLVMNLMGQATFSNEVVNNPFETVEQILEETGGRYDVSFLDFHTDATGEKYAMGFFLDGRVDVVCGTHTHVPTCDARVLPKGTLYVTDAGMTGNIDSVLGVKKEIIIERSAYAKKQKFEWEEEGNTAFRSVFIDTEARTIERVDS